MQERIRRPVGITVIGSIFSFLGFLSLFFAFIALISGSYGVRSPFGVFMDLFMRILWIGTPFALFAAGIGLSRSWGWSRTLALITGIVLALESFIYGMIGLFVNFKENVLFSVLFSSVCFLIAAMFGVSARYLASRAVQEYFRATGGSVA